MEKHRGWLVIVCVVGVAGCSSLSDRSVVADPSATPVTPVGGVERVFEGAPSAIAPRIASECTRRRIAVLENTPERVVCKHIAAGSSELVNQPQAELWTFSLTSAGDLATKVEARRSFDAVADGGYAMVSFSDAAAERDAPIRSFMDEVQALDGLRGRLDP